ncbi:MAG: sulfite exporter TauE/SafE family protein [Bacillota bacterium]
MTYLPFADTNISLIAIFMAGLIIGVFKGVFGKLANIIIVPALSILGLPISISVSTGVGVSLGRTSLSIFAMDPERPAFRRAGLVAGIIGLPGAYWGLRLHLLLADTAYGNAAILLVYASILLCAATVLFRQWYFFHRNDYYDEAPFPPFGLNWRFPLAVPGGSGLNHITLTRVALTGLLLGIATGFIGLGAGILGIPLFMYILGLPPKNAAATDSIAMLIISSGTLLSYASAGRVELITVLALVVAVALGNRIGSLLPGEVSLSHARLAFAILLATAGISAALSLGNTALSLIIITVAGFALCIFAAVFSAVSERILDQEKRVARNKNLV